MHKIKGYKDEWRIQEYLLITFFISWLSWGILVTLSALGITSATSFIGGLLFFIGGFGPTISAILCLEGKLNARRVLNFIFDHKQKAALFFMLFAILFCATIGLFSQGLSDSISTSPWLSLPIMFITFTLFNGGNQELGWRGTFQPVLERVVRKKIKTPVLNFAVCSLIVGAVWAIWYLPLWFVAGTPQHNMNFGLFAVSIICAAFWLAAIYRRTGSVFCCMLFHGVVNFLLAIFVVQINWPIAVGYAVLTILAVILASRSQPVKPQVED